MTFQRSYPVLAVTALLAAASCSGDRPSDMDEDDALTHPAARYELQIVRTMGWRELADSTGPLSDTDRKASAAVLATPLTAVTDADGRTYVLDGMNYKIVVFGPDGQYERVILGGEGKGPGEFTRPYNMAISGDRLYVLDGGAHRVTVFNADGTYELSFNYRGLNAIRIAATPDRVYISSFRMTPSFPAIFVYDGIGSVVDSLVQFDGQAASLASHGAGGAFGSRPDGTLLFALPTPSAWVELERSVEMQGHSYFPDAMGYMRRFPGGVEAGAVPVRSIAIAGLRDGSTLVYYLVREGGAVHGSVTDNGFIDVYDGDGRYQGSAELGDSVVYNSMHAVNGGPELVFTTMSTEYPEVRLGRLIPWRIAIVHE